MEGNITASVNERKMGKKKNDGGGCLTVCGSLSLSLSLIDTHRLQLSAYRHLYEVIESSLQCAHPRIVVETGQYCNRIHKRIRWAVAGHELTCNLHVSDGALLVMNGHVTFWLGRCWS